MPDITMCVSEECPKKESCHRYTAIPTKQWQSYSDFKCDEKYDNFWDNDGRNKNKKVEVKK